MALPEYSDVAVDVSSSSTTADFTGKSVLVTGGARGLGKAYAQAFVGQGAFVTVVDLNKSVGTQVATELGESAQFIECDVTQWDDLVRAFDAATTNSPHQSLDIVIANAGIVGQDDMFTLEDPAGPPRKPNLKTMDVNLTGLLYTVKLAIHYFRRQPQDISRDRCLILKSSLAGYVDLPGSIQYNASKFGVRGVMRSLRRTTWSEGIRVNLVAPWYIRTPALSQTIQDFLDGKGVGFALVEDCCKAMVFLASNKMINGRALGVVPRKESPDGIMDLGLDDYPSGSTYWDWQKTVLETASILVE